MAAVVNIRSMKNILVLCTGNSCRSQIAHGYLQTFASDKAKVYSAGVETHGVNPRAIQTMKEDGIDISNHTSNNVLEYIDVPFDFVITVCDHAKEVCTFFPSIAEKFHYNFTDSANAVGTEKEIKKYFSEMRFQINFFLNFPPFSRFIQTAPGFCFSESRRDCRA